MTKKLISIDQADLSDQCILIGDSNIDDGHVGRRRSVGGRAAAACLMAVLSNYYGTRVFASLAGQA